jgi:transposase
MEEPVGNYLKVEKRQQVIALLALGWSYRRIERETGVRRETVAGYDHRRHSKAAKVFPGSEPAADPPELDSPGSSPSKAAKVFPGSPSKAAKVFPGSAERSRSAAAVHHDVIVAKLEQRLSVQRVWQDLVEEYGYAHSYESVKRYVRGLCRTRRVAGVLHSEPGEEGQIDFFRGAPTLHPETGQWRRPWVFRLTLSHSRHGYEEAVWDQKLETFLGLHERAFRDLGGVPKIVKHDNLKAAVVRACLYDPDVNVVYAAFAEHWGFTPLPTRPRHPQENGKQERSGGYVKDNALKGRRFGSLEEHNAHLRRWNRTIARLRIHGTTRRQVWTHFLETDKPALGPLAPEPFALFTCGERIVHPDGHVEVDGAFYPVPSQLLGRQVQIRRDARLLRVYYRDQIQAVHVVVAPGRFAPREDEAAPVTSSQRAFTHKLLGRCRRVGEELQAWAEEAVEERGVRALRLIQGALTLTRKHPREAVLRAARIALDHRLFRYRDLRRLTEQKDVPPAPRNLLQEHPSIRPIAHYRLEDFL